MSIDRDVPAFPNSLASPTNDGYLSTGGMSLRDYFAAKAVVGLMGRDWSHMKDEDTALISQWGRSAYAVADAMLAARDVP